MAKRCVEDILNVYLATKHLVLGIKNVTKLKIKIAICRKKDLYFTLIHSQIIFLTLLEKVKYQVHLCDKKQHFIPG